MEKAIHITDVQRSLDTAKIWKQKVDIGYWKMENAEIIWLKGWVVIGSHWRGGTHNLCNPVNGQKRTIRDINIFSYNNRTVYV